MDTFGAFETGRVVDSINGATVYEARKEGDPKGQYVVKVFSPERLLSEEQDQARSELDPLFKDIGASFTNRVNLQKKASETSRCFAPILAAGHDERGAWYATLFYARSVRGMLEVFVALEVPDLFRIVESVIHAALHLKQTAGRSHGNLKPSNIFIEGLGKPRTAPVVVADPLPGGAGEAARYEQADLRSIGELIYQLVLKRKVDFAAGYVILPVESSREWTDTFGKKAAQWLSLCNKLLDPQLPGSTYSLEQLAADLAALKPARSVAVIAIPAGAAFVLVGAILAWVLLKPAPTAKGQPTVTLTTDPPGADVTVTPTDDPTLPALNKPSATSGGPLELSLPPGKYTITVAYTNLDTRKITLNLKPGAVLQTNIVLPYGELVVLSDPPGASFWLGPKVEKTPYANHRFKPGPLSLQLDHTGYKSAMVQGTLAPSATMVLSNTLTQPQKGQEKVSSYNLAVQAAQIALEKQDYAEAAKQVKQAERNLPEANFEPESWAKSAQALPGIKKNLQDIYRTAYSTARAALATNAYALALTNATQALAAIPDDPEAKKLHDDIQRAQKESERIYQAALKAAQDAMTKKEYALVVTKANEALKERPDSLEARQLKSTASQKLEEMAAADRNYATALTAAQQAMGRHDYETALTKVEEALRAKPDGPAALALRNDAQQAIKDRDLKYQAALNPGLQAMQTNGYAFALSMAEQALKEKPRGAEALALQSDAQKAQKESLARYQAAMAAARKALDDRQFEPAISKAQDALKEQPNSKEAADLLASAQRSWQAQKEADQKYASAMAAARKALDGNQYEVAVANAKEALVARPGDVDAARLRDTAQQRWTAQKEAEQKYASAMDAARKAMGGKQYKEAIAQATVALSVKAGDADAARLRDDAQKTWDNQDLATAQTFFDQGDYTNAVLLCRNHSDGDAFKSLAASAGEESKALDAVNQQLAAGNYSFLQSLKAQTYSSKRPFADSLKQGEAEQVFLGELTALKQQNNWVGVLNKFAGWANQTFVTKLAFQQFRSWADQQSAAQAAQLNSDLKLFKIWFLKEKNDTGLRNSDGTKASQLGAIGNAQDYYLKALDALKERYRSAGRLTPDVDKTFSDLRKAIERWD